jgi:hypothetical protein
MIWLRDLVFDTPWWILLAIGVVGIVVWVSGNNRQNKRLKLAGLIVLLLGAALFFVSWLVDTPKEIAVKQTHQFINAIVARDKPTLRKLLHPKIAAGRLGRDDVVEAAPTYADQFGLRGATITGLEVAERPEEGSVTTTFAVFSKHESAMIPTDTIKTSWQFVWLDTDNGWQLRNIEPLGAPQMDQNTIRQRYLSTRPH